MLVTFKNLTPTGISSNPSAVKSRDINEESSRKRRAHRKSREGCKTCRMRHMKCDEQRPECGQCVYGRRSCTYSASAMINTSENENIAQKISIQNHDPYITKLLDQLYQESHCKNVNLTSLYSHFFETTYPLWMGSHECQNILQRYTPMFIVGSPFLLHAILAFSAYHMALTAPESHRQHYDIVGACHYSLSLEKYRVAIDDEKVDANALFACCMLLTLLSFRNLGNSIGDGDVMTTSAPSPMLNMVGIRFIGGPKILAEAFERQDMLDQDLWRPLLHYCEKSRMGQHQDYVQDNTLASSPGAQSAMLQLEKLCRGPHSSKIDSAFDTALTSLRWLMQCYITDKSKISQFTFCFAIKLDPLFLQYVEDGETKALLVMCYWYALVRQVDQWWAVDTARAEGRKLLKYLKSTASSEVQELLDFPEELLIEGED